MKPPWMMGALGGRCHCALAEPEQGRGNTVLPLLPPLTPTPMLPLQTLHSSRPMKMLPSMEIPPALSPNSGLSHSSSVFL